MRFLPNVDEEYQKNLEELKDNFLKEVEFWQDWWNKQSYVPDHKREEDKSIVKTFSEKIKINLYFKDTEYVTPKKNLPGPIIEEVNDTITNFFDKQDLAKQIFEVQPYFYDEARSWWLWNDEEKYWGRVDDTTILLMVGNKSNANTVSSKDKGEILESMKQEGRSNIPLDIKPTWIQFKDMVVDILSGEEFKADPKYFITNPINTSLDIDRKTDTPVMDKIFEEWVGKKYVQTLYEILAYSMLPDYPIHRLFCFVGEGMNGKSCYLELLRRFIGANNCCSTELDTLLASRFEVTRLHKKLVCQMGETNFNEMSKTSTLKKLTGGDLIGFEYKNKDPFDDKNYAKILISTNNLPSTSDKTIGFYRRWMIIDFPNRFTEQRDILKDIPEEEYKCLAVKCITILKKVLEKREFTNEGTIEERQERYEAKSNFLEKFITESTREDLDGFITKAQFFKKFSDWSKTNRHRSMSEIAVSKAMNKMNIESDRKHMDWMHDGKGGTARIWTGISWKDL